MIGFFRKFLSTRAARLFFVVLIIPFVMWGVADVARNFGRETALATVGDRKIEGPEFAEAYRQQLSRVSGMLGGKTEPTPEIRRAVAGQTLQMLIDQAAMAGEVRRLGLAVPDDALRQAVFAIPTFAGPAGFDRARFQNFLQQRNMSEGRFLELMRTDLGQQQLMDSVSAGAQAPDVLLKLVFAFQHETRVADLVELPFTAAPEPPAPTPEDLHRAYDDDPGRYSAPAFRHIKLVVLSPDTVARTLDVPDADIAAYYASHKSDFGSPEKRSIQVLVAQDEDLAKRLATQWTAGADWPAMQKAATDAGASSAVVDDATRDQVPGAELAEAAFAAAPNAVSGPIKSPFGWQVLRVVKVTPGNEQPLEAVRDDVKQKVARERAVDEVYTRANKLEDTLSAGNTFDQIPADLGATVLGGTLDAKGDTPTGEPAPLPGTPALRQAILTAAFAAPKNEPPHLVEGPDQSYFALTVDDETAPAQKPFDTVEAQVRENWIQDARRKAQETVAARLLGAVNAGGSLDDAATIAGVRVEHTPPIARGAPTPGVPTELVAPVFALKPGAATMVETPEGFLVARLASVQAPDPGTDPIGASQMRTQLSQALGQDLAATYAMALRDRAKPTVNRSMLDSLAQ